MTIENKLFNKYLAEKEKGIYLESKYVKNVNGVLVPSRLKNAQHLYLVYRDGNGNQRVIRGGAGNGSRADFILSFVGEDIETEDNIDYSKSKDHYSKLGKNKIIYAKKIEIPEKDLENIWKKMSESAKKIHDAKIDYDTFGKCKCNLQEK